MLQGPDVSKSAIIVRFDRLEGDHETATTRRWQLIHVLPCAMTANGEDAPTRSYRPCRLKSPNVPVRRPVSRSSVMGRASNLAESR